MECWRICYSKSTHTFVNTGVYKPSEKSLCAGYACVYRFVAASDALCDCALCSLSIAVQSRFNIPDLQHLACVFPSPLSLNSVVIFVSSLVLSSVFTLVSQPAVLSTFQGCLLRLSFWYLNAQCCLHISAAYYCFHFGIPSCSAVYISVLLICASLVQ